MSASRLERRWTRVESLARDGERRRTMRALSVLMSLLLFSVPVLASTGDDGSSGSSAENDWTITLTVVGLVGVGLALLAIFTPEEADDEVVVSNPETDETTADEEALEAVEASREAEAEEEQESTEDDLFKGIEGD